MTLDFIFKTCTGHDTAHWSSNGELNWYNTYANGENPGKGILSADWNEFPRHNNTTFNWSKKGRKFQDILERAGYKLEWSDQTTDCDNCHGCINTEAQHMFDTPHYAFTSECSITCETCIKKDPSGYLEFLADERYTDSKEMVIAGLDPTDHGYKEVELKTTDKASEVAKVFKRLDSDGYEGVIFQSQKWDELKAWAKKVPTETESMTYGTMPERDIFDEHFENELDGDEYRITLGRSDSDALEDTELGDGSYSADKLWSACNDIVARQNDLPEGAMEFVSGIMTTLKFEWIWVMTDNRTNVIWMRNDRIGSVSDHDIARLKTSFCMSLIQVDKALEDGRQYSHWNVLGMLPKGKRQ